MSEVDAERQRAEKATDREDAAPSADVAPVTDDAPATDGASEDDVASENDPASEDDVASWFAEAASGPFAADDAVRGDNAARDADALHALFESSAPSRDETVVPSDGEKAESLLAGFGERPSREESESAPEQTDGTQRTGWAGRLTRGQLIAMGVGVVVTLAGVGWAVAAPSSARPVPTASATADPARAIKAGAAIDGVAAQLKESQGVAAEFGPPLAALQGASDEPARAAAESARQVFVQALAQVKVPAKPPRTADEAALAAVEKDTAAAQNAIITARAAFHSAISSFVGTIPGYAVQVVKDNADGSADLRKAATSAAIAMAASDPFTPPWFGPWDAWRAALAALIADAGSSSGDQPWTDDGDGGGTGGTDTPAVPSAPPVDPAPSQPPAPDPPTPDPPTNPDPTAPPTP